MKYIRRFKDTKKRKNYKKIEILQRVFRVLFLYSDSEKFKFNLAKKKKIIFSKTNAVGQIKNFCIITGRSRGVYRNFKVSRIMIGSLSTKGYFFGLKKASW